MIDEWIIYFFHHVDLFIRENVYTVGLLYALLKWLAPKTNTKIDDWLVMRLKNRLKKP